MTPILPFAAWRYHPERVSLGHVLAPPRESLRKDEGGAIDALFSASPYGAVRLELGSNRPGAEDISGAAAALAHWRSEQALVKDAEPMLYLYEQTKGEDTARGVVTLVKLKDYSFGSESESEVSGHDLDLLRTIKLQTAPAVASFHADDATEMAYEKARPTGRRVAECTDRDGARHRLWQVNDPGAMLLLRDCFAQRELSIHSGHSRCMLHTQYRNERRADDVARLMASGRTGQLAVDSNAPYEWMMMGLFPAACEVPEMPAGLVMYALEA